MPSSASTDVQQRTRRASQRRRLIFKGLIGEIHLRAVRIPIAIVPLNPHHLIAGSSLIIQQSCTKCIHKTSVNANQDLRNPQSLFTRQKYAYIPLMFADLLKRLTAPEPAQVPDQDARLALGALLVRIARSDGDYSTVEIDRIDRVLAARYALAPSDTAKLRADCETLETEAPDTVRFTRAIKDAVAYEDRKAVISALWEIVLADGERDDEENSLMRMIAPMLGVTDQDSNAARRAIEANS